MNFSTYTCKYCGQVVGQCKNPECIQKGETERLKEISEIEKHYQDIVRVGSVFKRYDIGEGGASILEGEYELEEIREDTKSIGAGFLEIKGIFKKVGTDERFLRTLRLDSNGDAHIKLFP